MKKLLLTLPIAALASCTSFQTAAVADYNRDGVISPAESQHFYRTKNVENANVYAESVKRRNLTNTMRDGTEALAYARFAHAILQSW